jgi:hypothetical protein
MNVKISDYAALKKVGLSPFKATEIVLDARRGIFHAEWWVRYARKAARGNAAKRQAS